MSSKDRVTLMVCTNAIGERAPLMMIGKSKKPRAFHGLEKPHGIVYVHQENAWINSSIASMWFREVFVPFKRKLLGDKEPAILFWDNAPPHTLNNDMAAYKDITILMLPPNLTDRHQPMDAGIIAALKCHYKMGLVTAIDSLVENWHERRKEAENNRSGTNGLKQGHCANLKDACELLKTAWDKVTSETIINCYIKADCFPMNIRKSLMAQTEKGQAKLVAMTGGTMEEDEGWDLTVEMSGQVEQLVEALDNLAVKIQGKRQDLLGANKTLLPVVMNLDVSAANVGVSDKNAAVTAICIMEENPEVVEDEVSEIMEQMEKKLWLPPSGEEEEEQEEGEEEGDVEDQGAVYSRVRLGRPAADAWLKDLEALAQCKEEVAAIRAIADKVLGGSTAKQSTLHSFFKSWLLNSCFMCY